MIKLFDFLFKKNIHTALKLNNREPVFHNMEDMRRILILFNCEDWDEIKIISQELKDAGKHVILWTAAPPKSIAANYALPSNVRQITQKEALGMRTGKSDIVREFADLSYDTLLDLTTRNDNSLLYLLATNKARFCIGIRQQPDKLYDFTVLKNDTINLPETFGRIKHYLNNIR